MYVFLIPMLTLTLGFGLWNLLGRTRLHPVSRLMLAGTAGITGAVLLYTALLHLSIFLFQWNDPIAW